MLKRNSAFGAAGLLVAAAMLVACGKDAGGPPPPPEVGVITLAPRAIAITDQLPGRTTAYRVAEVRPQVTGIVQKRLFVEGGEVKAGEQLFQIDAGSYRAALRVRAGGAQARRSTGRHRQAPRGTLRTADRGQRRFTAGERRRHRGACARRRRRGRRACAGRERAHQRGVHAGAVAHHRANRPRAGHRRRAGHFSAGEPARHRAAARSYLRRHHAVLHRDAAPAAPARERRADARTTTTRPKSA